MGTSLIARRRFRWPALIAAAAMALAAAADAGAAVSLRVETDPLFEVRPPDGGQLPRIDLTREGAVDWIHVGLGLADGPFGDAEASRAGPASAIIARRTMAARPPDRRRRLRGTLLPAWALTAALLAAGEVEAAPAAPSEAARAQAERALKEGNALFTAGQYQRALERYQAAQQLVASPKLLFNFAQTYRQLGRDVEALEAYQRFLAEVPDASPEYRRQSEQRIGELLGRIGHVQVSADLDGAEVLVDGQSRGSTPLAAPIRLAPGPHQVVVQPPGPGARPFVERIEVQGGKSVLVRARFSGLDASAAGSPASAGAGGSPAAATPLDAALRRREPPAPPGRSVPALRRVGQATAAAGVVLAGAGGVMLGSSWLKYSDARDGGCLRRGGEKACAEDAEFIDRRNTQALVLLGAAAAAAVTGGILWYLHPIASGPGDMGLRAGAAWRF